MRTVFLANAGRGRVMVSTPRTGCGRGGRRGLWSSSGVVHRIELRGQEWIWPSYGAGADVEHVCFIFRENLPGRWGKDGVKQRAMTSSHSPFWTPPAGSLFITRTGTFLAFYLQYLHCCDSLGLPRSHDSFLQMILAVGCRGRCDRCHAFWFLSHQRPQWSSLLTWLHMVFYSTVIDPLFCWAFNSCVDVTLSSALLLAPVVRCSLQRAYRVRGTTNVRPPWTRATGGMPLSQHSFKAGLCRRALKWVQSLLDIAVTRSTGKFSLNSRSRSALLHWCIRILHSRTQDLGMP
jgi:hypothetical protein